MEPTAPSAIPAYIASFIRQILTFVGGYIVAKGYLTTEQLPEVIGAIVAIVSFIWSLKQKKDAHTALKDATQASKP